jgi:hypothetical protein
MNVHCPELNLHKPNCPTKTVRHNFGSYCTVHCNGNSVYIFLSWELRGLSPNFHIHVSVSDLYIPRIGPHMHFLQQKRQTHRGSIQFALRHMNVEIGTETLIFLFFCEYLLQIFGILSLQCI